MFLELIPARWLAYEPPSLCHTGLETLFALGATAAAGAGTTAAVAAPIAATTAAGLGTAAATGFATGAGAALAGAAPAIGGGLAAAAVPAAAGGILGTGLGLAELGTATSVIGTGLQIKSGLDQAEYAEGVAKSQAEALRQKANEDAASAQRAAETQRRRTQLALSRAQALGAASGTLATDPTQLDIEQGIAQQGEYNALSALYEGMAKARSGNFQAEIDLFKGQQIGRAAPLVAAGQGLAGISSFAERRRRDYLLDNYNRAV